MRGIFGVLSLGWGDEMIVSEKQLQMLFQILVDSLPIVGGGSPFHFDREARQALADEILNQQSKELKNVSED